ncbi:uncharacterized protein LOC18030450 [Eutrema salsugineum]|nr:uncharacterized protein LOC18030450 [Eutrema salsugineum]
MSLFEPVYAASANSMESRKRKSNNELTCRGVPLPYLIRPRKKLPVYDGLTFYNEYLEYSSVDDGLDSESDDGDSPLKAVETSSLENENENNASLSEIGVAASGHLSDEEYVVVEHVEAMPQTKTERAGAIQMMELSKDTVDESESGDEGSNSDDWVVV